MSWQSILKNEGDIEHRKYNEDAFEEIVSLLKKMTGENWRDIINTYGDEGIKLYDESKSSKILDEYNDEHPMEWEHDQYSPHLVEWLKERLK